MIQGGVFGLLIVAGLEDVFRKRVHLWPIVAFGIGAVIMQLYLGEAALWSIAAGVGVGLVLLVISLISDGQVGLGDAAVVIVTGIFLGFWQNLGLLWLSTTLAGCCSLVLWLVFRKGRKYEVPFIPFMLVAYACMEFIG